jgi:hypothetical protein
MSCGLASIRAAGEIYRLGRRPDPWRWPDWAYAGEDGTFGNRYDDPRSAYRVLYASSLRLGSLLETLARFRPDPAVLAVEINGDPRDEAYETLAAGVVPASWLDDRTLGIARCDAAFADVGHARSLAALRTALAADVVRYGLEDVDAAAIRAAVPRGFTQEISRYVYECTDEQGDGPFRGIGYLSRLGDDIRNWAIFEPAEVEVLEGPELDRDDPDLRRALSLYELELGP